MTYMQTTLDGKQDWNDRPLFQGGSLASLTALQESVRHLLMNVTCGRSTGGSLASLNQDGLWLKMYGDCLQVKMDGSFEEYSEILPTWGLMLDGVLIQPLGLEPCIDENEFSLLPTPQAVDYKSRMRSKKSLLRHARDHQEKMIVFLQLWGYTNMEVLETYERVMGFPIGWTELEHAEIA